MRIPLVLLTFAFLPGNHALAAEKTNISVKVSNIPSAEGQVCVSLHMGRLRRPGTKDNVTTTQCVAAAKEGVAVDFKDIDARDYAISAFHDKNSDMKLGHLFAGKRREAFAYYGDPSATPWKTVYKEVSKNFTGGQNTVEIRLKVVEKEEEGSKPAAEKAPEAPATTPATK